MNDKLHIAFIGLGARGLTALRLMLPVPGAQVVALCDVATGGVEAARTMLAEYGGNATVHTYVGKDAYTEACLQSDVELVYICSDWQSHTRIALEALRCGKHVAVEVPAATTMQDIELLVAASRSSQRHCFLLENCCYDPAIEAAVADVRRGAIGEPVHAEGCYYHHLAERWTKWRLEMNRQMRGDLYPTHEMAPLCQALGIGIDDELQTLVAMDTAPFSGSSIYKEFMGTDAPDFQNGNHTCTLIRTRRGRTILLKHDVMSQRPYERLFRVVGTKGVREVTDNGDSSHDALTWRMNERLVSQLLGGKPLDWDVTDLARWCAVIPLSRLSIERGFMPVEFPQF